MRVVVGTFNMSFMSDLGTELQFASEATFLNSLVGKNKREYWINSLRLINRFLISHHPIAIGLQEINMTNFGSDTGSSAISGMLHSLNFKCRKKYDHVCSKVEGNNAGLSIIFDTEQVGWMTDMKIIDNPEQKGRPLLMIFTSQNNLLVNLHGAQDASLRENMKDFNKSILKTIAFMKQQVKIFVNDRPLKNVFVMGDFNDRYDAIKEFSLNSKRLLYKGESPYSCCHNWDSSCSAARYKPFDDKYGTCNFLPEQVAIVTKRAHLMGEEGYVKNYRYKGDKVFGTYPLEPMEIYNRKDKNVKSTESDHEFVYGIFELK
jgi:hypothetical protein